MNFDLSAYIGELLYEHETVVLPGFGSFVTEYKPATIDYVQGLLYPPSKSISFNENLRVDDGVLLEYLRKYHGFSAQEAREAVESFVNQLVSVLEKKEMIVFPQVGRMYRNYENELLLLCDSTNFNTESYALPTVQFFPVFRERTLTSAPTLEEKPADAIPVAYASSSKWPMLKVQTVIPATMVLLITVCIFALYYNRTPVGTDPGAQKLPVSQKYINQKPSHEAVIPAVTDPVVVKPAPPVEEEPLPSPKTDKSFARDPKSDKAPAPSVEKLRTPAKEAAPSKMSGIVVVGKFQNKANIQKLSQRIKKSGYGVYQDQVEGLTRIGIRVSYTNERELDKKLQSIRKSFAKDAFLLTQ